MKKKIFCLLLCLMLLPCTVLADGGASGDADAMLQQTAAENSALMILQTGDINGCMDEADGAIGMPKLGGLMTQQTEACTTLLLDSGNALGDDPEKMLKLMGAVGYHAAAIGTRDAALGKEALQELAAKSSFPLLCANWLRQDGELYFEPYTILDIGSARIGVIGLISPEIAETYPELTAGDNVYDPAALANIYREEMDEQGCTFYIALTSLGMDSSYTPRDLAAGAPWLGLIYDSNTGDTVLDLGEAIEKTNSIVFNQKPGFTSINELQLMPGSDGVAMFYPYLVSTGDFASIKPSAAVQEVLNTDYSVTVEQAADGNGTVTTTSSGTARNPKLVLILSFLAVCGVTAAIITLMMKKKKK